MGSVSLSHKFRISAHNPATLGGMDQPDRRFIACNYREGTGVAAEGALAYVILQLGGNLPDRVRVLARSRGGRWVEKWESMRRLTNFRLKTIPPAHPRYGDERINWADATDENVAVLARVADALASGTMATGYAALTATSNTRQEG